MQEFSEIIRKSLSFSNTRSNLSLRKSPEENQTMVKNGPPPPPPPGSECICNYYIIIVQYNIFACCVTVTKHGPGNLVYGASWTTCICNYYMIIYSPAV